MLKKDILNNTNNSDKKYKSFLDLFRKNILTPVDHNKPLIEGVNESPLTYLPTLIKMSIELEIHNKRPINCFPLRKSIIPKYMPIDTTTLVHMLFPKEKNVNKKLYLTKGYMVKNRDLLWTKIFKTGNACFKSKKYRFYHMIFTDGIGCSVLLIRKDKYNKDKRNKSFTMRKPKSYKECYYLNEISETERVKLTNYDLVGIDPGKDDLIYCTNGKTEKITKNNKVKHRTPIFRYSQNQRRYETKSKRYHNNIYNLKKNTYISLDDKTGLKYNILECEEFLCQYSSKSCMYGSTQKYIDVKNIINKYLHKFYVKEIHRRYKWFSFINVQRSETKMINNFRKKFGSNKKVVVCIGDWSQRRQMKYKEPTKGKSFRKLFMKNGYKTYLINEYNTSKKSFIDGTDLEKFRKKVNPKPNKNNIKVIHGLLRSKSVPNNKSSKAILFNRDFNGAMNILRKAQCIIKKQPIPLYLTHSANLHRIDQPDRLRKRKMAPVSSGFIATKRKAKVNNKK